MKKLVIAPIGKPLGTFGMMAPAPPSAEPLVYHETAKRTAVESLDLPRLWPASCPSPEFVKAEQIIVQKLPAISTTVSECDDDTPQAIAATPMRNSGRDALWEEHFNAPLFWSLWFTVLCSGLVLFSLAGVAFALTTYGYLFAIYILICVTAAAWSWTQWIMYNKVLCELASLLQRIERALPDVEDGSLRDALLKDSRALSELLSKYTGSLKIFRVEFCVKAQYFFLLKSLPAFVDPILDAANASRARKDIGEDAQMRFASSWRGVLGWFGDHVADLGLAGVLFGFLILAIVIQLLAMFITLGHAAWTFNNRSDTYPKYHSLLVLGVAADIVSFGLIGEVASVTFALFDGQEASQPNTGRAVAKLATHFVAEGGFSLWFGSTLFALSYNTSTIFGRATSLLGLAFAAATAMLDYRTAWAEAKYFLKLGSRNFCLPVMLPMCTFNMVVYGGYVPVLVAVPLIILCAVLKVAGVWYCESRVLNLTAGCM